MDLTCWQSMIPGSTPLSLINIPGSHDSSTQFVTLSPFSRCQNKSIDQQLETGIRFLDIRLELNGSEFNAVHGIADCRTSKRKKSPLLRFEDTFDKCLNFLRKHPTEAIIISLKMERGNNGENFFVSFYDRFIEPYFSSWFLKNRIPLLNECRGKLVLMRRCDLGKADKRFTDENTGINFTKMIQQNSTDIHSPLLCLFEMLDGSPATESAVIQDRFMLNPKAKWKQAAKAGLDSAEPNEKKVFIHYMSTAGVPFIPYFNSNYVNSKFINYKLINKKAYGWVVLDFLTKDLTSKIIESNVG